MPITAAPSAPAKKTTRASSGTPSTLIVNSPPLSGKTKERAEGLQGWFQIGQVACIAKGWKADAGAIGQHGEKLSEEVARVGDNVELVGKGLDILSMTGPYAALMAVALPFVAQIAMNHKIIPESLALEGTAPPAMLEAQITVQLVRAQKEALLAQKEAQAELLELQASMNGDGS